MTAQRIPDIQQEFSHSRQSLVHAIKKRNKGNASDRDRIRENLREELRGLFLGKP